FLEKQSVSGERGCERIQRRRDPHTPAGCRPPCQGGERREQQGQLSYSEAWNENFYQPRTRPAATGQALIEGVEACGNRLRPGSPGAAPDGRMLEQPSQFQRGRHVGVQGLWARCESASFTAYFTGYEAVPVTSVPGHARGAAHPPRCLR